MRETIQNAHGKQFHAVSLSGGKDSTAMLLLMIERDMPINMVLSADAYYAAMYLLTSNDDIYRRTANCFCKDGIEFGYAVLKNTSPHNYALFMAARDLCDKTEAVTMADLAEPEVIDPEALRLIVNATLIARYGLAAFQIRARGAEYER